MLNQRSTDELTRWARELTRRARVLSRRLPDHPLPVDVKADIEQATQWLLANRFDRQMQKPETVELVMRMAERRLAWMEETLAQR